MISGLLNNAAPLCHPKKPSLTNGFLNSEEAWFWFIRCQKARWDGARFEVNMSRAARPCDPDDIYRAVMSLYRNKRLKKQHLSVLARFGLEETPPDARERDQLYPARLWDEALDLLTTILKKKNLIDEEHATGY